MKGLDGIQGPIYVGTGCVFRRQALYGFDAPKAKKPPSRTCNCLPKWCCGCCSSGRKKKKKTNKPKSEMKKKTSRTFSPALEGIEEGIEGNIIDSTLVSSQLPLVLRLTSHCISDFFSQTYH